MDHIDDLRRDGAALVDAAEAAGLDAPIAHCPGWDVARLLRHTGKVLERTTIVVAEGLDAPPDPERFGTFPEGPAAFDRFREVLAGAVDALGSADPAGSSWNFTGEDTTNGFWRRRMANEVAVHRWDAEQAAGTARPVDTDRAVDGIDELATVMLPFSAAFKNPELDGSVHLHCTDADGEWLLVFRGGRPTTTREHAKGDLAVRGPASSVFLWCWNRLPVGAEGLESFGDDALLEGWASVVP
jgi:uncharacterized protein (TIGR03083 family)